MIGTKLKGIEEFIIEELTREEATAKKLLQRHTLLFKPVTLQAVYKALKKLTDEAVLLKHKNKYSLDNVWRRQLILLLQPVETFPELHPNESITYSFKSLPQLDAYWKHIQEGSTKDIQTTYFFCPHQYWWFVPGRRDSEIQFYKQFEENKRNAVLLLGGSTAVDKQLRSLISNPYVQVHTETHNTLHIEDTITVKNDIIISTRLPKSVSTKIQHVFSKNLPMEETENLLRGIFSRKIAVKIRIERNAKKAEKLTKQIGKYFYIKNK
jgi:hypothetical protein